MTVVSTNTLSDGTWYIAPPTDEELSRLAPIDRLALIHKWEDRRWELTVARFDLDDCQKDLAEQLENYPMSQNITDELFPTDQQRQTTNTLLETFDYAAVLATRTIDKASDIATELKSVVTGFASAAIEMVQPAIKFIEDAKSIVSDFINYGMNTTARVASKLRREAEDKFTSYLPSPNGQTPSGFPLAQVTP